MNVKIRMIKYLSIIFMVFPLWSCATLTLHVDVYKGPIVNHEKVLISQTVHLAETAKPLLVLIRNSSEKECEEFYDENKHGSNDNLQKLIKSSEYIDGFSFCSGFAKEVNGLLKWYENELPDGTVGLTTLARNYANNLTCRKGDSCFPEVESTKEELLEGLIKFSQKTLALGNNDLIIPIEKKSGFLGISNYKPIEKRRNFLNVLQSVGNTIQFHIDEIYHKGTYDTDIEHKGEWEQEALLASFPKNSTTALEKIITSLGNDLKEKQREFNNNQISITRLNNQIQKLQDTIKILYAVTIPGIDFKAHLNSELGTPVSPKTVSEKGIVFLIDKRNNRISSQGQIDKESKRLQSSINELDDYLNVASRNKIDKMEAINKPKLFLEKKIVNLVETKSTLKTTEDIKNQIEHAYDTLRELKFEILQRLPEDQPQALIDQTKLTLNNFIETAKTKNDDVKKKRYENTLKIIEPMMNPLNFPDRKNNDSNSKPKDAKEVMDEVIAVMKYEHIQTIRAEGMDSPTAKQLEAAIKISYQYRGNLVHIRPAVSYLRTSYPATSLQSNPNLRWENTLSRDAMANLPFIGKIASFYSNLGDPKVFEQFVTDQKAYLQQNIDKQYWQNINKIKLSGGGNVNYVLIKDDIGNWVVKNYSADTKPIIESAKGLALFAAGGGAGNFLTQAATQKAVDGPNETVESKASGGNGGTLIENNKSLVENKFQEFQTNYEDMTKQNVEDLKQKVLTLQTNILSAWNKEEELKNVIQINKALAQANETHLFPLEKGLKNIPEDKQFTFILKKVIYFQDAIDRTIYNQTIQPNLENIGQQQNLQKNIKIRSKAMYHLRSILNDNLSPVLQARSKVLNKYWSAITITQEYMN